MQPPTACHPLTESIDVVELGARSGLLWSRNELVLAGLGEALRIPVERPQGAHAAQQALGELANGETFSEPAKGPVAFAAFPFDRQAPGELIIPEIVVGQSPTGEQWLTTVGVSADSAHARIASTLAETRTEPQPTSFTLSSPVTPEFWRDEVVAVGRDRIRDQDFNKVVLARELLLTTDQPIDQPSVLRRLHQGFSTAIVFAVDGFVGASPELLVSRQNEVVSAHPLAGTAPRSSDPAQDAVLAAGLTASTKDQIEHRITIDWLLDSLLPFCSYVDAEPEPVIITLPNVHHLGTRVEGRLSTPAASVLDLVGALHPTPAVGGDPQDVALAVIEELEPGDRNRYAGPVGWVDSAGNGEFAVAVRSGQIDNNTATVWAGVGVVGDSDPEAELAETRAKFQAMLGALVRP